MNKILYYNSKNTTVATVVKTLNSIPGIKAEAADDVGRVYVTIGGQRLPRAFYTVNTAKPSEKNFYIDVFIIKNDQDEIIDCAIIHSGKSNRNSSSLTEDGILFLFEKDNVFFEMGNDSHFLTSDCGLINTKTTAKELFIDPVISAMICEDYHSPSKNIYTDNLYGSMYLDKYIDDLSGEKFLSLGQGVFLRGEVTEIYDYNGTEFIKRGE